MKKLHVIPSRFPYCEHEGSNFEPWNQDDLRFQTEVFQDYLIASFARICGKDDT